MGERMPWDSLVDDGWTIIGMNHYLQGRRLHLYVCMGKDNRFIKVEGLDMDAVALFNELAVASGEAPT